MTWGTGPLTPLASLDDDGNLVAISPDNPLPISGGGSSGGTGGDINVSKVGGNAVSSSIPVALSTAQQNALAPLAVQPVSDNGGSLTVDVSGVVDVSGSSVTLTGSPAVSGTVAVSGVGGTVTVGTHAVTQSGTWTVAATPNPTVGSAALTVYRNVALSNTAIQIKSGVTRWHTYSVFNPGTVLAYLQVWNALAASVTVGTTQPFITVGIPAGSMWDGSFPYSPALTTGFTVAATLNADGTGGAPATALGVGVIGYL